MCQEILAWRQMEKAGRAQANRLALLAIEANDLADAAPPCAFDHKEHAKPCIARVEPTPMGVRVGEKLLADRRPVAASGIDGLRPLVDLEEEVQPVAARRPVAILDGKDFAFGSASRFSTPSYSYNVGNLTNGVG
jgi:hypothetical protein